MTESRARATARAAKSLPAAGVPDTVTLSVTEGQVLTVAGPVLKISGIGWNSPDIATLARFVGYVATFTTPSGVFTARVIRKSRETASPYRHYLVVADIQVVSGTYPDDGDLPLSAGVLIEAILDYTLQSSAGLDVTGNSVIGAADSISFAPEVATLFQVTGPAQTVATPVPDITGWSDVYMFTQWGSTYLFATYTGSGESAAWGWPTYPTLTFSFTGPNGPASFDSSSFDFSVVFGPFDPIANPDADSVWSAGVNGWSSQNPPLTLVTGTQYVWEIYGSDNLVNVDFSAVPDISAVTASGIWSLSDFSWSQGDLVEYHYPTTVDSPRSTYMSHPFSAGRTSMTLKAAGQSDTDSFSSRNLTSSWTGESGSNIVSKDPYYNGPFPADAVVFKPENSAIRYRNTGGWYSELAYDAENDTVTVNNQKLAVENSVIDGLSVWIAGSPKVHFNQSHVTSVDLQTTYYDRMGNTRNMYLNTFPVSDTSFWTWIANNPYWMNGHYPVLFNSYGPLVSNWWALTDVRGYDTFHAGGTSYNWFSADANAQTVSIVGPHDLSSLTPHSHGTNAVNSLYHYTLRFQGEADSVPTNPNGSNGFGAGLSNGYTSFASLDPIPQRDNSVITGKMGTASPTGVLRWTPSVETVAQDGVMSKPLRDIRVWPSLRTDAYHDGVTNNPHHIRWQTRISEFWPSSLDTDIWLEFYSPYQTDPVGTKYTCIKTVTGSATQTTVSASGDTETPYMQLAHLFEGSTYVDDFYVDIDILFTKFRYGGGAFIEATVKSLVETSGLDYYSVHKTFGSVSDGNAWDRPQLVIGNMTSASPPVELTDAFSVSYSVIHGISDD